MIAQLQKSAFAPEFSEKLSSALDSVSKFKAPKSTLIVTDGAISAETLSKYSPSAKVVDISEGGLTTLSEAVKGVKGEFASIQFFTHATNDTLLLGEASINEYNVKDFKATFKEIGKSLTDSGDLVFYGCNLAATDSGKSMLNAIAKYSKADVAASTDLTGASKYGANYNLEFKVGRIQAAPITISDDDFDGVIIDVNRNAQIITHRINVHNGGGLGGEVYRVSFTNPQGKSGPAVPTFTKLANFVSKEHRLVASIDLDQDGLDDPLWQHSSGSVSAWSSRSQSAIDYSSSGYMRPTGSGWTWKLAGAVDVNKDGCADFVWRDAAGNTSIHKMRPDASQGYMPVFAGTHWNPGSTAGYSVEAVGMYAGVYNGKSFMDPSFILKNNSTGAISVRRLKTTDGSPLMTHALPSSMDTASNFGGGINQIVGLGDFNNNYMNDLVVQNSQGVVLEIETYLGSNGPRQLIPSTVGPSPVGSYLHPDHIVMKA